MEPKQFAGMPESTEHGLRERLRELEQQNEELRRDIAEIERLVCDDCKLKQLLLEEYALQHAHEALYLIDAHRRLVYVNAEACRALGYSQEELLGMTVADIDAHYSSAELIAVQEQGMAEGTIRHETRHRRRDGSTFPVEIQSSSFEYQGQNMGIALARDISERKRYEAELQQTKDMLRQRNAELQAYQEQLEQRVAEQVADLRETERKLEASRLQLRRELAQREEMREEERKRLAREVHDELGQILTGLQLHVSTLKRICDMEAHPLCGQVREISALADQAMAVARNIAVVLRPVEADMGIVPALELQASRFCAVTGIHCKCDLPDEAFRMNERCTTALYRIVQELLTNVARHAQADEVMISMYKDGESYVARVRDNGTGFDLGAVRRDAFGLAGIRERVLTLGGTVEIDSKAGKGTEVRVRIPAEVCHD